MTDSMPDTETDMAQLPRVLVVDDHKTVLELIQVLLNRIGYRSVDTMSDGDSALKVLEDRSYGLILADWNMEPTSGLQLLRRIRSNRKLNSIPFILMSASMDAGRAIAVKNAGVDTFIVKPFTPDMLRRKLETVLRREYHAA